MGDAIVQFSIHCKLLTLTPPYFAALGVKTIIDLTDNSMSYEKPAVEAAGRNFVKDYWGQFQAKATTTAATVASH